MLHDSQKLGMEEFLKSLLYVPENMKDGYRFMTPANLNVCENFASIIEAKKFWRSRRKSRRPVKRILICQP